MKKILIGLIGLILSAGCIGPGLNKSISNLKYEIKGNRNSSVDISEDNIKAKNFHKIKIYGTGALNSLIEKSGESFESLESIIGGDFNDN